MLNVSDTLIFCRFQTFWFSTYEDFFSFNFFFIRKIIYLPLTINIGNFCFVVQTNVYDWKITLMSTHYEDDTSVLSEGVLVCCMEIDIPAWYRGSPQAMSSWVWWHAWSLDTEVAQKHVISVLT